MAEEHGGPGGPGMMRGYGPQGGYGPGAMRGYGPDRGPNPGYAHNPRGQRFSEPDRDQ